MAGDLLRFVSARVQGRKTLMMTMSGELGRFFEHTVLPVGSTGKFDRATVSGLLAIKFGSEINISSLARDVRARRVRCSQSPRAPPTGWTTPRAHAGSTRSLQRG